MFHVDVYVFPVTETRQQTNVMQSYPQNKLKWNIYITWDIKFQLTTSNMNSSLSAIGIKSHCWAIILFIRNGHLECKLVRKSLKTKLIVYYLNMS